MKQVALVVLLGTVLAACWAGMSSPFGTPRCREDPVTALEEAVGTPAKLQTLAPQIGKELGGGCYFGQEATLARAVAPVWQACPQDPKTHNALNILLAPITEAILIEDPALARNLFVDTPLACLEKNPESWDRWLYTLHLLTQPFFADFATQAASRLMAAAGEDPQRLNQLVQLIAEMDFSELPAFTPAQIDRLIDHVGNKIFEFPEILSRIPGHAGTEALLRFAERESFSIPPELAPYTDASSLRRDAMWRLEGRELSPEDLQRVAALAASEDEEVATTAIGVLVKHLETLRAVTLPEQILDRLAYQMRVLSDGCKIADILATQGKAGAERLYAYWLKVQEGRARGCGWGFEQALKSVAPYLRTELIARYRTTPDPELIPYLVAAGATDLVAEIARSTSDAKVRNEIARQLAEYLPDHPDDAKAREALRRAALEEFDVFAWQVLLKVGDAEVSWDKLVDILRKEGLKSWNLWDMFLTIHLPAPQSVLAVLMDIATSSKDRTERIRALEAAQQTPEWAFRQFSTLDLPEEDRKKAQAVLARVYALEPRVRALLNDPDEEVRRAVAGQFAEEAIQDVAPTKVLMRANASGMQAVSLASLLVLRAASLWIGLATPSATQKSRSGGSTCSPHHAHFFASTPLFSSSRYA